MTDSAARAAVFLKGHGTENDFVLLPDIHGALELSPEAVVRICDRRAGIGADGVLRVAPSVDRGADFFMDYRNADGSVAETCGNGLRVFARYLVDSGLRAPGRLVVSTRAGTRTVTVPADGGDITAAMGQRAVRSIDGLRVLVGDRSWPATDVSMGNPHAVVIVDDLADAGDLLVPPSVTPAEAYPEGVNVEFVVRRGPRHLAMRVHERGSGETRSCGTGACAAAVAASLTTPPPPAADATPTPTEDWTVDVPGGRLIVTLHGDGSVDLTGPAVIVAEGVLRPSLLHPEPVEPGIRAAGSVAYAQG